MRIYSFECPKCGGFHDEHFKLEPPAYEPPQLHECPDCKTLARRVFTKPAMIVGKERTIHKDKQTGEQARTLS